jgi:tetratricopeptide (TPR) repeat protein
LSIRERKIMEHTPATVEQVREAQEYFRRGLELHEAKSFKEAIDLFKKCASINPYQENHLSELAKKLKTGSYKLLQECVAYMGCAAVHLHRMAGELDEEGRSRVPMNETLVKVFAEWDREL